MVIVGELEHLRIEMAVEKATTPRAVEMPVSTEGQLKR